jgi:hypothetical protein
LQYQSYGNNEKEQDGGHEGAVATVDITFIKNKWNYMKLFIQDRAWNGQDKGMLFILSLIN